MGIVVPVALTMGSDTQRGGGNLTRKATERQLNCDPGLMNLTWIEETKKV